MGLFNYVTKDEMQVQMNENAKIIKDFCKHLYDIESIFDSMKLQLSDSRERIEALQLTNNDLNKEIAKISNEHIELTKKIEKLEQKEEAKNRSLTELAKKFKDVHGLNATTIKYFLHEQGYFTMKINPSRCVYATNENSVQIGIKSDLSFNDSFVKYLKNNKKELQESVRRYNRRTKAFNKAKKSLQKKQVKDYRQAINKICGVKDNYNNGKNWGILYDAYSEIIPTFRIDAKKYCEENINPFNNKKPTYIEYVVKKLEDGERLLKIACEIFVK